jgi:hypothetical protein
VRIVCAGHLVRYPLGGHSWHHLQYLVGFRRLGHHVTFVEDWGWPASCYDPAAGVMTSSPAYGVAYVRELLATHGLERDWCYLAEDGSAHGLSRGELGRRCREADLFVSLSNVNLIPEAEACRRRALVDTDPVFTQIGVHGLGPPFDWYDVRFTYGENVHRLDCAMPTGGVTWTPTRQPVVLDLWPVTPGDPRAPLTTVMNWSPRGECERGGRVYGQKDREFAPFVALPRDTGLPMELALSAPPGVCARLAAGGWRLADPRAVTRSPAAYQAYLAASRAEFSVAKHGYVSTRCGWFSERSAAYLASGRPVVVQDTGFSRFLPSGTGVLAWTGREDAIEALGRLQGDYAAHCRAARAVAAEHFDARRVLGALLEACAAFRAPVAPAAADGAAPPIGGAAPLLPGAARAEGAG